MKRRIITSLILVMVVSVSIFGLTLMNHSMDHDSNNCAASQIVGMKCPDDQLTMAEHHIAYVKEFSNALIPQVILILALFAIIACSSKIFKYLSQIQNLRPNHFYLERNTRNLYFEELHHWLSRFELSPSFAIAAR